MNYNSKNKRQKQNIGMNRHKITISVELQPKEIVELQLSPSTYKESFREFKQKYGINENQAFKLKNLIQAKLIQIATNNQNLIYFTPPRAEVEKEEERIDSPRFQKICNNEESQTDFFLEESQIQEVQEKIQQRAESEEDFFQDIPLISKSIMQKQKESLQNIEKEQSEPPRFSTTDNTQIISKQHYEEDIIPEPYQPPLKVEKTQTYKHQYVYDNILPIERIKTHKKPKRESVITKKVNKDFQTMKTPSSSPLKLKKKEERKESGQKFDFDRLYYQGTDSFKSKKNEQIDRKQLLDYREVQRYEVSNRLKRTTPEFFYQLHKHTTQSWQRRMSPSPEKSYEEEESIIYKEMPRKVVPLAKAFKGSSWESRMRCQAHEYKKKIKAEEDAKIAKEASIKKRVQEEYKTKAMKQVIKDKSLSRVCDKCSPKKPLISPKRKSLAPKSPPKQKKKYFSNLLLEAFQQRKIQNDNLMIS